MKEIIRLGLILMIICVISAGALAYTNFVTSSVIERRLQEEKVAQMRSFFPAVEYTEEVAAGGRTGMAAFDAEGNYLGVLAEARTEEGYGGTIRFNLGVDASGKIVGISIVSHSETAGLGSKIAEDSFLRQFMGKGPEDSFDVDNITGATDSTRAMERGVELELREIVLHLGNIGPEVRQ